MAKKMLIDATHAEETRVVVVDGNKVEEFDFESENKRQLAGNIYLAKVTRVEPSLQAAFVDYGGNRHGFLAFSEIHPDYYQIPVADREALLAEEEAYAEAMDDEERGEKKPRGRSRSRSRNRSKAERTVSSDIVEVAEAGSEGSESGKSIPGMDVVDLDLGDEDEGSSPMDRVAETPVETPPSDDGTALVPGGDEPGDDGDAKEVEADDEGVFRAVDSASERDSEIESVAEEDDSEEIRQVRKPRPRKYKIQEVIKVRQIMLVQVVKEERGNKGAALTTYLSLAGRYCVLMPNTARGGGISRKITNAQDRKKLKEIASEIDVPRGAGLIVRTAGAKRTKTEIKRDYEYLQRLWEQIRELTLKSIAPAKIYEEGNLIKRSIRDLYSKDIDEVLVEGDLGYRTAKDFMKMIMPSHAKNVKHYAEPMPLFARYQVESYLGAMFNPVVQLRSGGYIVIGVTEALVAIDINSGKATKKGSIEETALETNLEAAEEIARQLRLRDLAGLIVIDFIDMEERRNNAAVEKRLKDKLKTDRARIQVGRISGFGLLEMSRQRLRPGMLEATTQPCPSCHGTGLLRSDDSLGLTILRQLEEEGVRRRSREVLLKAPVGIVNFLINQKRDHIAQIESRYGMAVRIEADPHLISPDFTIEKFKTATRVVEAAPVVSVDASLMPEMDEEDVPEVEAEETAAEAGDEQPSKKKRRRRRRRKGGGNGQDVQRGEMVQADNVETGEETDAGSEEAVGEVEAAPEAPAPDEGDAELSEAVEKPKPRSRSRSRARKKPDVDEAMEAPEAAVAEASAEPAEPAEPSEAEIAEDPAPKPKRATRSRKKATGPASVPAAEAVAEAEMPGESTTPAPEPAEALEPEAVPEREPEPAAADEAAPAKPKRSGWWSVGR
jgi:ribonuclease E